VNYPSLEQVQDASHEQLARWYRHLQSPQDEAQVKVMERIVERFQQLGGFTPELSKRVGW
jgi:hypothetical protein